MGSGCEALYETHRRISEERSWARALLTMAISGETRAIAQGDVTRLPRVGAKRFVCPSVVLSFRSRHDLDIFDGGNV